MSINERFNFRIITVLVIHMYYSVNYVCLVSLCLTDITIWWVCAMFSTVTTGNMGGMLEKIIKSLRLFCVRSHIFLRDLSFLCPLTLDTPVFFLWCLRQLFILFSPSSLFLTACTCAVSCPSELCFPLPAVEIHLHIVTSGVVDGLCVFTI